MGKVLLADRTAFEIKQQARITKFQGPRVIEFLKDLAQCEAEAATEAAMTQRSRWCGADEGDLVSYFMGMGPHGA